MLKINRKYLPSKNFVIALSIAIAIILISVVFIYWKPSVTKYKNPADIASSTVMNIDSDNDGLPDWKEALYGTNPNKADTDGDGTNDGDEIAQNRDPLKKNTALFGQEPNDKIDTAIVEQNQKILDNYQNLSEIAKFSRDLVSNITASVPTNGTMSTDTVNSLVSYSLKDIPQKQYVSITKAEDLNLLPTDSTNLKKNFTNYQYNYATETEKLVPLLIYDIQLTTSYKTTGSTSTSLEILKIVDKYQSIVDNLIKMPVPVAIGYYDINYHLLIINDLEKIIAIDKDIANSDKNSLVIFSDLSAYDNTVQDLLSTLKMVDGILKIKR